MGRSSDIVEGHCGGLDSYPPDVPHRRKSDVQILLSLVHYQRQGGLFVSSSGSNRKQALQDQQSCLILNGMGTVPASAGITRHPFIRKGKILPSHAEQAGGTATAASAVPLWSLSALSADSDLVITFDFDIHAGHTGDLPTSTTPPADCLAVVSTNDRAASLSSWCSRRHLHGRIVVGRADMANNEVFGVSAAEWEAAYDRRVQEFAAHRYMVMRDDGLIRIAFGLNGPPTDEAGGRGPSVFTHAVSMTPALALVMARGLTDLLAQPETEVAPPVAKAP